MTNLSDPPTSIKKNLDFSMRGKICLVTGATHGIGAATALGLARRGATVLVHGRSAEKAKTVVEDIQRMAEDSQGTNPAQAEFVLADFADLGQVRRLADAIHARFTHLDVLINNAGAFFLRRQETESGFEMTFAVDHLAPFLLTNLLLDLLYLAPEGRIVNVSSNSHLSAELDFIDLQTTRGYGFGMKAYGRAKLANLLFTYELVRRLNSAPVSVNALHPGFVATNIGANSPFMQRFIKPLMNRMGRSPERGAETSIYLACSPEVAGVSGKYYIDCLPVESSPRSYNVEDGKRLWETSKELVEGKWGAHL
jgi:NAD(P)-dependent dehydrogenase (short-subunit alcohol dehydrogenase family)